MINFEIDSPIPKTEFFYYFHFLMIDYIKNTFN